jgi:hypothetical protein
VASGVALCIQHRLQDHPVLVGLAEDGRDLALAEGVVEVSLIDCMECRASPPSRGRLYVGPQSASRASGDIAQQRIGAQALDQPLHPVETSAASSRSGCTGTARAGAGADLDVPDRLK